MDNPWLSEAEHWQRTLARSRSNTAGGRALVSEDLDQDPQNLRALLSSAADADGQDPGNDRLAHALGALHCRLGRCLEIVGDLDAAEGHFREAVVIAEHWVQRTQQAPVWSAQLCTAMQLLGDVLEDQGDEEGSTDLFRKAQAIAQGFADRESGDSLWMTLLVMSELRLGQVPGDTD